MLGQGGGVVARMSLSQTHAQPASKFAMPATTLLRRFPDVSPNDPLRIASMYEHRARDAERDAAIERRAGRLESAEIFERMRDADLQHARAILEMAAADEDAHAA